MGRRLDNGSRLPALSATELAAGSKPPAVHGPVMNSKRTIGSLLLLSGCASSAVPGIEMSRPDVAPSTAVAGPDGGSAGAALLVDSLWESSVPDSSSLAEQPEASTNTIVDRHGREIPKQYACIVNLLEH